MANFYISDLHIGHENILRFDNRPFADVNEMNNKLIENWNARVRSDDTVYILGDFIWAKESEWPSIVGSLAGNKVLIRGNHDPKQFSAATKRMFQEITDLKEIKDSGKHVVMCHYPIPFFRAGFAPTAFMLYGHVHQTIEYEYIAKLRREVKANATGYANRKVWWKCEQGHEWFTLISTRAYGSKCLYCSGIKLLKGFNDLASLHPQLALEWSQKNGPLLPEDVNERSTKNVWWKCSTCGHEYRAVIKSKVHGLKCPVCTRNAVLLGYSDLATTDPELAQEWNAAKNTRKPTEISRLSQYPVWWKGICGHEWKDKVFHRAVEGAGCIYCEKAFLKELPYLLVTMYAKQYGLATRTDDEKLIGARIDAVIPELRLAFAFSQKGTDREAKVAEVLHFLCKAKRIQLFVIRQKDPIALATEIKQAFAKANLFINSDSQRDVAHLRKRYFAQKNNGN